MATFRTYAEVLSPDDPMMKNYKAASAWRPSRYRPAGIEQDMRAEPGVVLGDVLRQTGGDIREIAELTSDDRLLSIAELPEAPVSLEHLRHVDPQTRMVVGYRLDVSPAESPRLRRRLALPPDPRITLHFDEVVFPGTSERFWSAWHWDRPGRKTSDRSAAPQR
jgi:hypothetical protein